VAGPRALALAVMDLLALAPWLVSGRSGAGSGTRKAARQALRLGLRYWADLALVDRMGQI
jgi:hypothetical protein